MKYEKITDINDILGQGEGKVYETLNNHEYQTYTHPI